MTRLLQDAQKLSGVEYNIDNLGDVYDAIHVIQGDLGLTGVAAAEASTTFSGSFEAMRAAGQNFLGSLSLGQGVTEATGQLVTSATTFFFNNFLPMIGNFVKSLPAAISAFLRQGLPLLVSNVTSMLSNFATSITSLANKTSSEKVRAWVAATIPKIVQAGSKLVMQLAKSLLKNLPRIVVAVGKIGLAIIKGLGSAIWPKITAAANGIKERFMKPINALKQKVSDVITKIKGFFDFTTSTPHIKLPHFSITPAGWKVKDLLEGKIPHLQVTWAAKGGIVDGASLIGAGEAGAEAIVPLDPFWKKLDKMATATNSTSIVININGASKDPREIAEEVKRVLIRETNGRRLAWQ